MSEIKQIWCEEDKKFYPEYKTENGKTYKLHPKWFVYLEEFEPTAEQQELMKEPIGRWGRQWRRFMEETYPEQAEHLKNIGLDWELIPRRIDREANELYDIVRKEYLRTTPRPKTFWETLQWEEKFRLIWIHRIETELIYLPWDDEFSTDPSSEKYPF